jgi:predicted nucleotidyltransferase
MIPNQIAAVEGRVIGSYIHGSIAYGTDHINSDKDERHIFVTSPKMILSDRYLDHLTIKPDITYYEIQFYLQQLFKGNFNCLDLLYSPKDCVIAENRLMETLKERREMFIHKGTVGSMVGAAFGNITKLDKSSDWTDAKTRKKLAEAQRLAWKAQAAVEDKWYVREPTYRAEQLLAIKLGTEKQEVMDSVKINVENMLENLVNSKEYSILRPEPYKSEYHNLLLKIRQNRL